MKPFRNTAVSRRSMHPSAMSNCQSFFDVYGRCFPRDTPVQIVEIGSLDVNGSLRQTAPAGCRYVGVDFAAGKGVDVILDDPYALPFASDSADVVLSSSCFEHSEMFWLLFLEIMRILKPRGLFYLNVPSNGVFHRYPVDCWRFYPDSGRALVTWAKRNGIDAALLESYTSGQAGHIWNDFVAVFVKDEHYTDSFPDRISDRKSDITNALHHGSDQFLKPSTMMEEQKKLMLISQILANKVPIA